MTTLALKERTNKIINSLTKENLEHLLAYASFLASKQKKVKSNNAHYFGALKIEKDALKFQKDLRNEWE